MSLAHVIAGAIAGAVVGGPPGAAVGGIIGALFGGTPAWDEGAVTYAPGGKVSTSRASTAAEVQAVVAANAAQGVSTLLSPDNALGRVGAAIDALAASTGPSADAWAASAHSALHQMTVGLMMTPGHFVVPPAWSNALANAPGDSLNLRAVSADAIAALTAMDSAKAKGLAEFIWT